MSATADLETIYFTSPAGSDCCCPHFERAAIKTCKRRYCPRCGRSWARSWETLTRENLAAYGGSVALITVTAPGQEFLPWACKRDHKHSGADGCRVEAAAADHWSERATHNWAKLRDAARASCRRRGLKPSVLGRFWEPQKRGVPHVHIVVGIASPEEREAAQFLVSELHRLAPEYFFGFVDRKLEPISAREASRYVAGYLLGRASHKGSIRENIADRRMPRSLLWVSPILTRVTLVTMRRLRYARWAFAAAAGACSVYPRLFGDAMLEVARVCVLLEQSRAQPPPDREERFQAWLSAFRSMRRLQPAWD